MYMKHWATGSFGLKTHNVKWDIFSQESACCAFKKHPLYMSSEQQSFDLLRCGFAVKSNLVFKCVIL